VFRRGSLRDVAVTVAEFEADRPTRRAGSGADPGTPPQAAAKSAIGVTVSDLSDTQKRDLRVRSGVKVDAVEGAAQRAGLREGDVILSIDNADVTDAKQFNAAAAKADKARAVSLLVRRGDWTNYIILRPAAR
jgi:serine protease Do